uniref:Uncharacterized protein n=1 Tax=Gossypium raimondii TaxID=29730 RepID=A0A0D2MQP1_GOSRA|nr:hypothetical protein B456_003G184400 [Gossypium raimondii]
MQRQSLGSPTSKLHSHGGEEITGAIVDDDDRRKDSKSRRLTFSASSSSSSPLLLPSSPKSEKLIHLIPVLTLLCFLILYLNSHSPSQSDLAAFNGFKHSSKHLGIMQLQIAFFFLKFSV